MSSVQARLAVATARGARPGRGPRIAGALALLGGIAVAPGVLAQARETPPPPGPPRPLSIEAPAERTLPNGLRVIVARRADVPLVSAVLVIRSGAEVDPPGRAGLASLTAGLLTQGTRRHSAPRIAAAAEALGGSLESGAGWDRSEVSITVTTPRLDAALGLLAEVATEPTFANAEIDRLRAQTLDQLKVTYASPGALARLAVERQAFGNGAYGHPANGTPTSLKRIGRTDVTALHRAYYRPDNAALVLAGDVDLDAGVALAARHFGRWRAPSDSAVPTPADAAGMPGAPLLLVDMPASGQAGVAFGVALPRPRDDERAIASVLNAVLGGGYSSRLNQEIRIRRGLSYGAGSQLEMRRRAALLRVAVQTRNETAGDVAALIDAEIDRLIAEPVGADELAARQATLLGDLSRSLETTSGLAGAIVALVAGDRDPAELPARVDALAAVTPAQIQRYAATHLGTERRRVVVAGEVTSMGEALARRAARTLNAAELDRDGASAVPKPAR
ncbi:M16 family metallopeptidase [Piscinibacter koreensis]|uniref:Insulinase family protein n=1 Tax=Piscinibacter koreensis TaxID=2742824 RepID=A0A7Y6NKJ4_9BURK|nr:pitrilysin family protein [Schlegelella koreensis]NUZ04807.1 insulinase family protein [Schlegelella koreensis]